MSQYDKNRYHRIRRYIKRRNLLLNTLDTFSQKIKSFDQLFIITCAIFIGVSAGYLSAGFRYLIIFFQNLFWQSDNFVQAVVDAPFYMKLLVPAIGGLIVASFVNKYAKEAKGHGVPEVMEAVASKSGIIRIRVVLVKAFASAISIGTGAAVGREGPIVQIGSAFGSSLGQLFQVSARRMNTFIGCGAAAGIAATFNAPIAGAIFASEVILGDFSAAAIGPIIISSVFGTIVSRSLFGNYPAFVPPEYILQSPVEIVFYTILGVAAGFVGLLYVKSLYFTEDLFNKWKLSIPIKALIGGSILGALAIFVPEIMGVGYESMDLVLTGKLSLLFTLVLLVTKIFATSLSLGYGASGGVFAPSLFMGAMLGGAFGQILNILFPGLVAPAGAYALVGMAALVSATTHAPITAILIIFEMTSEYSVILPLMVSSIIAMVITTKMLDGNIYTLKLKRRGVDIHGGADRNILNQLTVKKLKHQMVEIVHEDEILTDLLEKMSVSDQNIFYAHDDEEKLSGIITFGMVRRFINRFEDLPPETKVKDLYRQHYPSVNDDTPIQEIMRLLLDHDMLSIPVVNESGQLTGQVHRNDILHEYQEELLRTHSAGNIASSMKFVHAHYHEKSEVIPGFLMARINVPSAFINHTLKKLDIRNKYHIVILLIRRPRGDDWVDKMPTPNMVIRKSDQLMLFGTKDAVSNVCDLL